MWSRRSNVIIALSKELECTYLEALALADRMSARGYEFALRDWIADAAHAMEAMRARRTESPPVDRTGNRRPLPRPRVRSDDVGTHAPDAPSSEHLRIGADGGAL
jgi:hypothetical protein